MSIYIHEYLATQDLYRVMIQDDKYAIEAYVTESEIIEEITSNYREFF